MRPTELLTQEHNTIKRVLRILSKICAKLEAGEKVDTSYLEQIADFITIFADKYHHGKEEGILFPAMIEAGVPAEGGPIPVMLQEHNLGRGFIQGFIQGIEDYRAGHTGATEQVWKNARNYINLLLPHIEKEENILYRIADMHITEENQRELLEKFEQVEREIIGEGQHEKFHHTIEALESIYS